MAIRKIKNHGKWGLPTVSDCQVIARMFSVPGTNTVTI